VGDLRPPDRPALKQAGAGEIMLAVEIRGDRQQSAGCQRRQGVFEKHLPHRGVVPVILMPDEDEIERRQLLHPVGPRGVPSPEIELPARRRGRDPARPGFGDLRRPEIDPEVKQVRRPRCHGGQQHAGLVGPAAGEVQ